MIRLGSPWKLIALHPKIVWPSDDQNDRKDQSGIVSIWKSFPFTDLRACCWKQSRRHCNIIFKPRLESPSELRQWWPKKIKNNLKNKQIKRYFIWARAFHFWEMYSRDSRSCSHVLLLHEIRLPCFNFHSRRRPESRRFSSEILAEQPFENE